MTPATHCCCAYQTAEHALLLHVLHFPDESGAVKLSVVSGETKGHCFVVLKR